jgi:hypothetical protein
MYRPMLDPDGYSLEFVFKATSIHRQQATVSTVISSCWPKSCAAGGCSITVVARDRD